MKRKYLVIVGTRPNFVKAAPLFSRVKEFTDIKLDLLHTGQHFDENMSKIFFEQMRIPNPDYHFNIDTGSNSTNLGRLISEIKGVLTNNNYQGLVVFGDVNSTVAGAIAASGIGIPLFHIESGLRSHDKRMPEEANRILTDHLSDKLFITEPSAKKNLLAEGVDEGRILLVGNIMIESLEMFKGLFEYSNIKGRLNIKSEYLIATIHRAENTQDKNILKKILTVLSELSSRYEILFPVHPGTKDSISRFNLQYLLHNINIIEPVGYIDFMNLVMNAKGVVTDSGGIQEETTHLGIPCCTLRDNTERPITVSMGTNKLFPIKRAKASDVMEHLESVSEGEKEKIPFWDDRVSKRILNEL